MGGDYTKDRFDPTRDYSAVLMQQGRVQLDSDWNEQAEILDRRIRAGALDVLGACAVSAETPDAFRIRLDHGELTVGLGRLYVDGLLAENHGDLSDPAKAELDSVLGELRGTGPTLYAAQPHLDQPDPLPEPGKAAIAYLDVWQREVSAAVQPDLIEPAIGTDTTTRLQTVWQLRLQPVTDRYLRRADLEASPEWQARTAPPHGRLSTVTASTAEGAGTAGGANHLYRVQIHSSGATGVASFKWSRDNASFSSPVLGMSADRTQVSLAVSRVDAIRLFSPDDWVEVIDDRRELAGAPGQLAKVRAADHVTATLTLSAALAPDFDPSNPARHTRVIRWDQKGAISAPDGTRLGDVDTWNGAIPIPSGGAAVVLEGGVAIAFNVPGQRARAPHGSGRVRELVEEEVIALENEIEIIEVTVSAPGRRQARSRRARTAVPGDPFRTADYWLIATRTGGLIDQLVDAPPRGIHHHFCPVAIIAPPERVVDCRILPEREERGGRGCGCSVCVTPRSHAEGTMTVKSAIDRVRDEGGVVCLEAGLYHLKEPLDLTSAESLTVRGQGWSTVLLYTGDEPAITIRGAVGVTLEELTVAAGAEGGGASQGEGFAAIASHAPAAVRAILDSLHRALTRYSGAAESVLEIRNSLGVNVRGCCVVQLGWRAASPPAITLGGSLLGCRVAGCLVVGGAGIGNLLPAKASQAFDAALVKAALEAGEGDYLLASGLRVEDNQLWCDRKGVSLEGFTVHIDDNRVTGNRIGLCREGAILVTGKAIAGNANQPEAGAFLIEGNTISVIGDGIVTGLDHTRVLGNAVAAFGQVDYSQRKAESTPLEDSISDLGEAGDGIVLAPGMTGTVVGCVVARNRVNATARHGIHIRAGVERTTVSGNIIEGTGGLGIVNVLRPGLPRGTLAVQDNEVWNVVVQPHDGKVPVAGIALQGLDRAVVSRNEVRGVAVDSAGTAGRDGIRVADSVSIAIAGNYVDIGSTGATFDPSAGVEIVGDFEDADVVDNQVRIQRGSSQIGDGQLPGAARWLALKIGEWQPPKGSANQPGSVPVAQRQQEDEETEDDAPGLDREQRSGTVSVRGNLLEADGAGSYPTVRIKTAGPCLFSDNRCSSVNFNDPTSGIVGIDADTVIVNANYVLGVLKAAVALELYVGGSELTQRWIAQANLTSGDIRVNTIPVTTGNQTDLV